LEEDEVGHGACEGPVEHHIGRPASPLIENDPDRLLSCEVGVPAPRPETGYDEAAVEIFLLKLVGDLGAFLVILLCVLVVCGE
jgi:hypothetical protein